MKRQDRMALESLSKQPASCLALALRLGLTRRTATVCVSALARARLVEPVARTRVSRHDVNVWALTRLGRATLEHRGDAWSEQHARHVERQRIMGVTDPKLLGLPTLFASGGARD